MNEALALVLASGSPRRREILDSLRLAYTVRPVDLDETPLPAEQPEDMVLRLAAAKADAGAANEQELVLGADTAVVVDNRALGKPVDRDDGLNMLALLSGRAHRVITGVALHGRTGTHTVLVGTDVYFRDISRDEALAYWQSGEPSDKAGAYAIQGLAGAFVTRIEGSYSNVVGLPVFETTKLLQAAGLDILDKQTR